MAAPDDPAGTAIEFLEKVRTRKLNLEPGTDTALSPNTSGKKRLEISRRLERLARDLGDAPLEVGPVKLDDDLAAVLVRKSGGFDPSELQVFPVALVRRGAGWTAAPVPASFENSGLGYAAALRKRLETLQNWMLREQALDLEKLRDQSTTRMRRKIETVLPAPTLKSFTPPQAAERFLAACGNRNLPEICGLLGGLAANLPEDWAIRLKTAQTATSSTTAETPQWRMLASPDVLRIPVHHEEDDRAAMVSVACLDPAGHPPKSAAPKLVILHFGFSKTPDGFWRIDPPPGALAHFPDPDDDDADADLDSDLLDAFPAKLAALYPPAHPGTAGQARQALISTLLEENLASLTRLIRLDGAPKDARANCLRAARTWWTLREPSAIRRPVLLASREDSRQAAAAFQWFSARNPDKLALTILYFEKSAQGWCWTPKPDPETEKSFREWVELQAKKWPEQWQPTLLTDSPVLEQIPDSAAPAAEASRKLVESWSQAIRSGDVQAALRLTARLNTPDSMATLLRNLGYEMTGSLRNKSTFTITDIHQGGIWTAVGAKTEQDGKPTFPLYPVISTAKGPRILLEIDLAASGNRSRDFLNKTSLDRLSKSSMPAAGELKKLFAQHQAAVAGK
jgi:hypothetical protein